MTNKEREDVIKEAAAAIVTAEDELNREIQRVRVKYSKKMNSIREIHEEAFIALKKRIEEIVIEYDKEGCNKLYTGYDERDAFSEKRLLKEIMKSDDPRNAFMDYLCDWETDYMYERGFSEVFEYVKQNLTADESFLYDVAEDEMEEFIEDLPDAWFHYDAEDFNCDVKVNLLIDSGNWNYDCTCDNVCNYCGNGEIPEESSILYLARKQGKEVALRQAMIYYKLGETDKVEKICENDRFVFSCIQEWENLSSSLGTLCFLVEMPLFTLFDIIEMQKDKNMADACITLRKDVMCGLLDKWNGGGSVLEIELDRDVDILIKDIRIAPEGCKIYGYDLQDIYGLCGSAWKDSLVSITKPEQEKAV